MTAADRLDDDGIGLVHADSPWWRRRWVWFVRAGNGDVLYGWHYWRWFAAGEALRQSRNRGRTWWQRHRLETVVRLVVSAVIAVPVVVTTDQPYLLVWAWLFWWVYVVAAVQAGWQRLAGIRGLVRAGGAR